MAYGIEVPAKGVADSWFAHWVEPIATGLEIFGVAIIILGVVFATARFASDWRANGLDAAYVQYRANLGRGILLGLEILVGADIISTVTSSQTWESVGLLGLIVLIRTLLSFSLEVEIEGRLPWRRGRDQPPTP